MQVKTNVQGIHLSWIVVKDLQAAITFYTKIVGLTLLEQNPEFGWAELSGPSGSRLGIAQESSMSEIKKGSNAIMTITVDNIEQACEEFQKQGGKLVGEMMEVPGHVKIQSFIDADHNTMQFVQVLSPHA
ncbi:MAG: VOC family protein [Chlamydiae bacterium]|nr:VOC family protein [Chlamydiota bacterium]